jgi:hypothetical protein
LDHPDERQTLGMRGKQKVERLHTWNQKYALVKSLYERLLNG